MDDIFNNSTVLMLSLLKINAGVRRSKQPEPNLLSNGSTASINIIYMKVIKQMWQNVNRQYICTKGIGEFILSTF